jgi:hypothetical protein
LLRRQRQNKNAALFCAAFILAVRTRPRLWKNEQIVANLQSVDYIDYQQYSKNAIFLPFQGFQKNRHILGTFFRYNLYL